MRRLAIGLAALALLVLCGDGAAATPRVTYTTSGGIAGISNQLVVSGGARAVLTAGPRNARRTFRRTLSGAAHRRLLRIVAAAHVERLRSRYAPRTPVADGIDQALIYRGRTVVVAQDGSPPKPLARALRELAKLASSLQR
jgi:hypothetical protein